MEARPVKFALGIAFTMLTVAPTPVETVWVETVVRTVEVERKVETPIADSLVDWDEHERQSKCLWVFLQDSGVELTLNTVIAAGDWTDALGGACKVIGEDDE